uniref:Peptidase S1 domain-containing protein n=1 Tax=Panagrolaimus sp. ES5 TaxID=591445 RepID=A0AC34G8T4_9BILA
MLRCFLFLAVFANLPLIYGYNQQRIGSSEITPADLFQFTVFLHSPGSVCTGTVISKRHVLTAAHFIYDKESLKTPHGNSVVYSKVPYHAQVRPLRNGVDDSTLPVTEIAYLPVPLFWDPHDDIAILEFPEGTNFSVEPVKLAKDFFEKEGDEAYIAGFGSWWENGW